MAQSSKRQLYRDSRWICIQVEQQLNRCLAPKGITAVQANILLYILRQGGRGVSLTDIHRAFGYSMATLSSMAKRLREKGYIRAERCQGDERCHLLLGTEKGLRLQKELEEAVSAAERQIFCGFSPEELATLGTLQEKLMRNLAAFEEKRQKEEQRP